MNEIKESEILKVFPEGKAICLRLVKEINKILERILEKEQFLDNKLYDSKKDFMIRMPLIIRPRERLLWHKNRLEKILRWADGRANFLQKKERILEIPITDYVEFNRAGFAKCLWHEERTPSMKYSVKRNKVHCFGCGTTKDVIDVVKQLKNCTFIEAISTLSGDNSFVDL